MNNEFLELFDIEIAEKWDNQKDWKNEWKNMPEFVQEDMTPHRTLYVHFENEENLNKFLELIDQEITPKTKYIWFPDTEKRIKSKYVDVNSIF
jgi:predicted AlkP superfamily phosphohydrolase/phosphomutase